MEKFSSLLGLDFGFRRIGVATSKGFLAEPVTILQNDENFFENLKKIIDEYKTEKIILGLSENDMAERTKRFARQLEDVFHLPVTFMDETLSSVTVHEKLAAKNVGKKQHIGPIDHFAAAEILQNYLDENS